MLQRKTYERKIKKFMALCDFEKVSDLLKIDPKTDRKIFDIGKRKGIIIQFN